MSTVVKERVVSCMVIFNVEGRASFYFRGVG